MSLFEQKYRLVKINHKNADDLLELYNQNQSISSILNRVYNTLEKLSKESESFNPIDNPLNGFYKTISNGNIVIKNHTPQVLSNYLDLGLFIYLLMFVENTIENLNKEFIGEKFSYGKIETKMVGKNKKIITLYEGIDRSECKRPNNPDYIKLTFVRK